MPEIVGKLITPRLAGAPSSPVTGEVYYNTATNKLYWWNGTAWVAAEGGAAGGGAVDYIGNWAAGTTYKQGDVVRYNNNDYLAVNPSTGSVPPAPASSGIPAVSVGTTLPASPFDGQEAILVDSLLLPSYSWRFRYLASITDAYKWIFCGGPPLRAFILTNETQNNVTSPADLATVVGITMPRAGIYVFDHGATLYNSVNDYYSQAALKVAAAAADVGTYCFMRGRAGDFMSVSVGGLTRTVAANDLVKQQYWSSAQPTLLQAQQRWIEAIPSRVS